MNEIKDFADVTKNRLVERVTASVIFLGFAAISYFSMHESFEYRVWIIQYSMCVMFLLFGIACLLVTIHCLTGENDQKLIRKAIIALEEEEISHEPV